MARAGGNVRALKAGATRPAAGDRALPDSPCRRRRHSEPWQRLSGARPCRRTREDAAAARQLPHDHHRPRTQRAGGRGVGILPRCRRYHARSGLAPPMNALALGLWLANISLDTVGQLAFKAAAGGPDAGEGLARWKHMLGRPWLWLGGACYVVEFLVWIAFLSLVPLSDGVLLGSINIVVVMLAGRWLFGARLTPLRLTGMALVSLGVAIVGAT